MALTVTKPVREFLFSGVRLPDPNKAMTVDDVRNFYCGTYPELATAVVNGPEAIGNKLRYSFDRVVGSKG